MRISIIIPVYKVEDYILQCLESIYQDVKNIVYEVIIVDDCTPDDSINIVNEFIRVKQIKNLKIIRHEKNRGLGAARNTGIEHAKYEYIWFIDSDDTVNILELDKISPDLTTADVILFGVNQTDEHLNFEKVYLQYEAKELQDYATSYRRGELKQISVVAWNKLIKTELFYTHLELRFDQRVINEDELFCLLLCKYCFYIRFIEERVYNYRVRSHSLTTANIGDKYFLSWEIIFEEAYSILKYSDKDLFKNWFLEKVSINITKYKFTPAQKREFQKLVNKYYHLYPAKFWETNWRFDKLKSYFDNSLEIYRNKSHLLSPKVSVIIPTYKRPESLINAVNSVLEQTYKNIEIIIVNDTGINHESQKEYDSVVSLFKEKVTYINLLYNTGGGNARNIGIENSTGVYICFLDDDDIYLPERIQNGVNALSQYNSADIWGVYCGYYDQSKKFENFHIVSGNLSYYILMLDYMNFSLNTNTVMIRKSFLEKHQINFDNRLKRHQDLDLFLRLFSYGFVIGYNKIDVKLRPKQTNVHNWLNNEAMHNNKRIFLRNHEKLIQIFGHDIQCDIYEQQWSDVLKYYLTENKIDRFEEYFGKSPKSKIDGHEVVFLLEKIMDHYAQVKTLNAALSSMIESIYNSNSWRITRPLRVVSRLVKGN